MHLSLSLSLILGPRNLETEMSALSIQFPSSLKAEGEGKRRDNRFLINLADLITFPPIAQLITPETTPWAIDVISVIPFLHI
jgi:hypothetical protein